VHCNDAGIEFFEGILIVGNLHTEADSGFLRLDLVLWKVCTTNFVGETDKVLGVCIAGVENLRRAMSPVTGIWCRELQSLGSGRRCRA
jgi:hypothetical protein